MHALFQPTVNVIAVLTTAVIVIFGPLFSPKLQGGEIEVALLIIFIGFISSIKPIQESPILGKSWKTQASVER